MPITLSQLCCKTNSRVKLLWMHRSIRTANHPSGYSNTASYRSIVAKLLGIYWTYNC